MADERTSGTRVLLLTALLLFGTVLAAWGIARQLYGLGDPDAAERERLKRLTEEQAKEVLAPQVVPRHAPGPAADAGLH